MKSKSNEVVLDNKCQNVWGGLVVAGEMGLLTLALTGRHGDGVARRAAVDHLLAVAADDPYAVKEIHMTCYHLLWEVIHLTFRTLFRPSEAIFEEPA